MKLYHGTSSMCLDNIRVEGLKRPYLTNSEELAEYYAGAAAAEYLGAVVLLVEVDEGKLCYDRNAMDEPVGYSDFTSEELEEAALEHPDWVRQGVVWVPKHAYMFSLATVGSCRCDGIVPPQRVSEIQ